MLGDVTAFVSLVFGYFFYWTVHDDFPPDAIPGPGVTWPVVSTVCLVCAWFLVIKARRWNRDDRTFLYHSGLIVAALMSLVGAVALLAGPLLHEMDPTQHVYPAIVWALVGWTALHVGVGVIMQFYCIARRRFQRMTARYDADIINVGLYWHFLLFTVLLTVGVVAGFPLLI